MRTFSFRMLLGGALGALSSAAITGLLLGYAPQGLLVLHLVAGIGGILPVGAFLGRHWWQRRATVGRHRNARWGYLALACLVTLAVTGVALLVWTNVRPLQWLHWGAMVVLALTLAFHMAWRIRRATMLPPNGLRWTVGAIAIGGSIAVVVWTTRVITGPVDGTTRRVALAHASLGDHVLADARNCASCHSDIADQWRVSAHSQSASDPYYQALAAMFIQERGIEAGRYCATCHNPVGLMQGEIGPETVAEQSGESPPDAYEARALGVSLRISDRASEGVTCVICHLAADAAVHPTNGSLSLYAADWVLPTNPVARLALRSAPTRHEQALMPAAIVSAQMCGSCHNLQLPDNGLKIEPTFDEWLASPYPEQNKTCQSCHMPTTTTRRVDSGLPEPVAIHGGLPGAPSTLPSMSDNPELLRTAASLAISTTVTVDRKLRIDVAVTNDGAGHAVPTGADDLRQVWLEMTVHDDRGQIVWQGGTFDQYGELRAGTIMFRKVLGDASGNPIDLHRFWAATQILEDTRLMPMETRHVPYEVAVPGLSVNATLKVTTRLLYRDVSQSFAEFALDRPMPILPVQEMARVDATVVYTP